MATIEVKNAAGGIEAIEKPLAPGRVAAAASRPVVLSTEDKAAIDALATGAKQDTGNGTLASILAKLSADPATSAGQAAIIAAIEEIPGGGGGGGGDASEETLAALQGAVGAKTDAKSTATDTTSVAGGAMAALVLLLTGCGDPASTYDPERGRYVSTEEFHRDRIRREIDREELRHERR